MDIQDYINQHYIEKRRLYISLFIIIILQLLIEFIIFRLSIAQNLKHTFLITFTHCIILFPIPFFYYLGFSKKLIYYFLLLIIIIFFTTLLIQYRILPIYFSFVYLSSYILLLHINKIYTTKLQFFGLNISKFKIGLVGIPVGIILCIHLLVSANLTKAFKIVPQLNFYTFFYLLGVNSPSEELFYRGFIFNELSKYGLTFFPTALISSCIYILRYLINPEFINHPFILIGLIVYLLLVGIVYCFLFRVTKTIYTNIITNFIFSLSYYSLKIY